MAWEWVYIDNYEWISSGGSGSTALFNQRWLYGGQADIFFDATDSVTSTRSLFYDNGATPTLWNVGLGGNSSSLHCGFWYKHIITTTTDEARTHSDGILSVYNSDGNDQFSLGRLFPGHLQMFSASTIRVRSPKRLMMDVWNYIEIFATIHNSTGRFVVAQNGEEVIDWTGDTRPESARQKFDSVLLRGFNTISNECKFDNFWIKTSVDIESKPTFYGPMKVVAVMPDADGNYTAWNSTASPTLYTEVDETGDPDNDTTYISTATDTNKASFGHAALNLGAGESIKALALQQNFKKAGLGGGAFRQFTRISSTDYFKLERFHPDDSGYVISQVLWEDSPATASAWTEAEVDAAEFGIEYIG